MSWGSNLPVGTRQLLEFEHLAVIQRILSPERQGWQHEASGRVEDLHREGLFTMLSDQVQALVRSQAGPGAGAALTVLPTYNETSIPSDLFRVVSSVVCLFPLLSAVADVAVSSTFVATIVQRAFGLGCWVAEDFHSRAPPRESAGKPKGACGRMCSSGTWIWQFLEWQTHGGGGRHPSERTIAVGSGHHVGVRIARGQFPQKARISERRGRTSLSGGKLPHTQSWRDPTAVPSLWCWLSRWADAGQMRQGASGPSEGRNSFGPL